MDTIQLLSTDLQNVDYIFIEQLLSELGWESSAAQLGYDVLNYDHMILAGRMIIKFINDELTNDIKLYLTRVQKILKPDILTFFQDHIKELQELLDNRQRIDILCKHDWLSANSIIRNYLITNRDIKKIKKNIMWDGENIEVTDYKRIEKYIETPLQLYLRIAVSSYYKTGTMEDIKIMFNDMCDHYYTPASPVLFNSGLIKNQLASCFLISIQDSVESIFKDGAYSMATISQNKGAIGIDISRIRHSDISHTGVSSGLIPFIFMFNATIRSIHQCVAPETPIYTKNGIKEIKKIVPGDKVLTDDGSYKKVNQLLHSNVETEGTYIIINTNNEKILVTPGHKFLILHDNGEKEWIKAKYLNTYHKIYRNFPNKFYDLDAYGEEDLEYYGKLLNSVVNVNPNNNDITIELNKEYDMKSIELYLNKRKVYYEIYENNQIYIYSSHGYLFGGNLAQNIIHKNFLHLPIAKTLALLKGYFQIPITFTTNYKLLENLIYICKRIGITYKLKSRSIEKEGKIDNEWAIIINQDDLYNYSLSKTIKCYNTIKSITKVKKSNTQWMDLIVDENPNYCTTTGIVHNGGKRKGACTIFCRPHHIDIIDFCKMPLKTGDHYSRAHDVNFALWFPWLFWKRVKEDGKWTLFCPKETEKLNDIWGIEWEEQYKIYEEDEDTPKKVIKARDLLHIIIDSQRKTGMPYILHADAANFKSNQNHLGYIRCSNLCLEIMEHCENDSIASCNLSSISLKEFVKKPINIDGCKITNEIYERINNIKDHLYEYYDFEHLAIITKRIVNNINQNIEHGYYPLDTIKIPNLKYRPLGIGVSGFAEMLHILNLTFHDPRNKEYPLDTTKQLNKMIFACIYFNALIQSIELSIKYGSYNRFKESPIANGKFQFDLWRDEYNLLKSRNMIDENIRTYKDDDPIDPICWKQKEVILSNGYIINPTWNSLRDAIKLYGIRNSLLIAIMPTATSAQPLRNGESVEAHQSNIYSRKLINGAYPVINRYMIKDLNDIGLWNSEIKDLIQADNGSVKLIKDYILQNNNVYNKQYDLIKLDFITEKYKTMWELSMKVFYRMAADRGRYICQSQSTNIYISDPSTEQLIASHLFAFHLGLKTGMYYLRQSPAVSPLKLTISPEINNFVSKYEKTKINTEQPITKLTKKMVCTDEICISCQ